MNLDSVLSNSDVRQFGIRPTACVVVIDAVFLALHSLVRVTAEDALSAFEARMQQGALRNFFRKSQPAGVSAVGEARERLTLKIELLQNKM